MSINREGESRLKRYDDEVLPPSFHYLTEQEKIQIIQRMVESDMDLRRIMTEKLGKSKLAEQDLHVAINAIEMLQDERKVFSHTSKGETGSGTYELHVRGGDTKFISSIALAVLAVIAFLFLLLSIF